MANKNSTKQLKASIPTFPMAIKINIFNSKSRQLTSTNNNKNKLNSHYQDLKQARMQNQNKAL